MRLTHITTATGDQGTTGLADGSRVAKTSLRIEAIGGVDELNSLLGLLGAVITDPDIRAPLQRVQHRLFDLGGELALPGQAVLEQSAVTYLEQELAAANRELPPLREFVLPGGNAAAAHCHHARAVCRRVERTLLRLAEAEPVNPQSTIYLNRLSDLLFVWARKLARAEGGIESLWERDSG